MPPNQKNLTHMIQQIDSEHEQNVIKVKEEHLPPPPATLSKQDDNGLKPAKQSDVVTSTNPTTKQNESDANSDRSATATDDKAKVLSPSSVNADTTTIRQDDNNCANDDDKETIDIYKNVNYWTDRHHNTDIDNTYFIDYSREVGRGTNSVVRKCIERKTGKRYAVKSVNKFRTRQLKEIKNETNILSQIDGDGTTSSSHPNIIKLYESYEDDRYYHIILDKCRGGELYDQIKVNTKSWKSNKVFTEQQVSIIIKQLLDAINYCHTTKHIVHRDIKLENILFYSKKWKNDLTIKLIDFGLATNYDPNNDNDDNDDDTTTTTLNMLTDKVGTNQYVAPEILDELPYTNSCDLWSIGIVTYALLSGGRYPFLGSIDGMGINHSIEIEFPSEYWFDISDTAKDFIQLLLQKDPSLRPSAATMMTHEWFQEQSQQQQQQQSSSSLSYQQGQTRFQKLKRVFNFM